MALYNGQSSPGVYFRENDLSTITEAPAVGITVGGVVGEFQRGRAFEGTLVTSPSELRTRFGEPNPELYPDTGLPKYESHYIADYFLQEANQMYIVRVLGLSGYVDLNGAYLITTKGNFDPSTATIQSTISTGATTTNGATYGEITADASSLVYLSSGATSTSGFTGTTAPFGNATNTQNPLYANFGFTGWFELDSDSITLLNRETFQATGVTYQFDSFVSSSSTYNYTLVNTTVTGTTDNTNVNPEYPLITSGWFIGNSDPVSSGTGFTQNGSLFVFGSSSGNTYNYSEVEATVYGEPYDEYDNMVVGVLRSKGNYIASGDVVTSDVLNQPVSAITLTGDVSSFSITVTDNDSDSQTYSLSLNKNSRSYIENVLNRDPLLNTSNTNSPKVWVEEVYPELVTKLLSDGKISGLNEGLLTKNTNIGNYAVQFQTPKTPYLVSELRGNMIYRLFRFVSISDGNSANQEVKLSIENIDLARRTFDISVRQFNDTDSKPVILERFTDLSMDPTSNNYILKRIGDGDEFGVQSNYIYIEVDENAPENAVPAGFEGYGMKNYGTGTKPPAPQYKTEYLTNVEKIRRVYLGVSVNAYDSEDRTIAGTGLDIDRYKYLPENFENIPEFSGTSYMKGFHMDGNLSATTYVNQFVTTPYNFSSESSLVGTDLQNRSARKFTVLPAGGFDGWDIYRSSRTNLNSFRKGQSRYENSIPSFGSQLGDSTSDYYAFLAGINLFQNNEEIPNNLLATGGIDLSNHLSLVNETVDIIENQRADMLYIVNIPNIEPSETYAEEIANIVENSGLDTSYAATYAPWIQIQDEGGRRVYIPPTAEVFRVLAFTDNKFFPWFAGAGSSRGRLVNAFRPRKKLFQEERDTLYNERVNPIYMYNGEPHLWGNRTLQTRDSFLRQISVRRLLLFAQRTIINAARAILFDQNDDEFEDKFLRTVNPILESIADNRGIRRFEVRTANNDATSRQRGLFYGQIFLTPIGAVEQIVLDFNVTRENVSFDEV